MAHRRALQGWVEEDKARANRFYDQEVTPRLMVLKISGTHEVVEGASEVRRSLNELRKLMLNELLDPAADLPLDESPEFKNWHGCYRDARDKFILLARATLTAGDEFEPRCDAA